MFGSLEVISIYRALTEQTWELRAWQERRLLNYPRIYNDLGHLSSIEGIPAEQSFVLPALPVLAASILNRQMGSTRSSIVFAV